MTGSALRSSRRWLMIAGGIFGIVVISGFIVLTQTFQTVHALKRLDVASAARHARRAHLFTQPLSTLTLHRLPLVEFWNESLAVTIASHQLAQQTQHYLKTSLSYTPQASIEAVLFQTQLAEFKTRVEAWFTQLNHQPTLRTWLNRQLRIQGLTVEQLQTTLPTALTDLELVARTLLDGQHSWILIFQNSHELRATGGFMGSYAQLDFTNGQLAEINVQDIYEPDGQFQGYVAAPPGVNEYLSSGQGLRLPDSNWSPDFPSSAQTILSYFALGKKQALEGVVSINLTVAEQLLNIVGPVELPDYNVTVTADNLAQVARADRDEFFPGSQAKPHFLSALFTQLKLRAEHLTPHQQQAIAGLLIKSVGTKDIQIFSTVEPLQTLAQKYGAAGSVLQRQPDSLYFTLIESNVGINKVNKGITRQVILDVGEYRTHVEVEFKNHQTLPAVPTTELAKLLQPPVASPGASQPYHYVNYQRVLLPADFNFTGLSLNHQPVSKWDETLITTAQGQRFKEIGFLVTVLASQTTTLGFDIISPRPLSSPGVIEIQKQSGLPATPYTLNVGSTTKTLVLEKDELVTF